MKLDAHIIDEGSIKMKECCNTCRLKKKLVKFDYSQGGCIHTDYEGYACLALAFEDEVVHMVGHDPELGMCEMYSPREVVNETQRCTRWILSQDLYGNACNGDK